MTVGVFRQQVGRSIGTGIVNDDHFKSFEKIVQRVERSIKRRRKIRFFVISPKDDRDPPGAACLSSHSCA